MAAINAPTNWLDAAARRFPRTPRHKIRGGGGYALVFKCYLPWRVNLYATAQERAAAVERYSWNSCGAIGCVHDHGTVDL